MNEAVVVKRRLGLVAAIFALSACGQKPPAQKEHRITDPKRLAELREAITPEAYIRPEDQKKAERLREGYNGPFPCSYDKVELGMHVIASLPTDQCYKMTKPERMQGLWRADYEGSSFCAAAAHACPGRNWQSDQVGVAWLEFAPGATDKEYPLTGGLYAVDFVGRQTAYRGHYGEYGFYAHDVIVDRLISIKQVGAPPPAPTKAQMDAWCEKTHQCIESSQLNQMSN